MQALGIAHGLNYLHEKSVVHGDLHWVCAFVYCACVDILSLSSVLSQRNVLISEDSGEPLIADFGISRLHHVGGNSTSTNPYSSMQGSFIAPEVMKADDGLPFQGAGVMRPTFEADVYSLGMMLIALGIAKAGDVVASDSNSLFLTQLGTRFRDVQVTSRRSSHIKNYVEKDMLFQSLSGILDELWDLILQMTEYQAYNRPSASIATEKLASLLS